MDFEEAWSTLELGAVVAVSNGQPIPQALETSLPMKIWRSHNFTGELVEKLDGAPRILRFDLPPSPEGNVIGWMIADDGTHTFDIS